MPNLTATIKVVTVDVGDDVCVADDRVPLPLLPRLLLFRQNSGRVRPRLEQGRIVLLGHQLQVSSVFQVGLDHRQLGLHGELAERAVGPVVVDGLLQPREDAFPGWLVLVLHLLGLLHGHDLLWKFRLGN